MLDDAIANALPEAILDVPLDDLDVFVNQSRQSFDEAELLGLAENIAAHGLLQPGLAWLDPGRNRLVLICGERRFRALKLAGKTTIAVRVIREALTPGQMLQMNLAENIQRASLNPIEQAFGFRRLMQLEGLNATEVAARMSVSNATVSNALGLLTLPESLQARVAGGELPASVASHLARLGDDETRRDLADQYAAGGLNRDGVAIEVSRRLKSKPKATKSRQARLVVKCGGGLAVTITAARPLTQSHINSLIARLRQLLKTLPEDGEVAHPPEPALIAS